MTSPTATDVLEGRAKWSLEMCNCLDGLRSLPDCSLDSMVTDPPGGIGFMGREWDSNKGGHQQWIDWLTGIMREALRVLKPGAHILVWSIPRTSHWTGTAIERAGFEVIDNIDHVFGSGFPKYVNVSKAIDWHFFLEWCRAERWPAELRLRARREWRHSPKRSKLRQRLDRILQHRGGFTRPVVSTYTAGGNAGTPTSEKGGTFVVGAENSDAVELTRTTGATPEAIEWDGWATALRPSREIWWLARKPLEGTIAKTAMKHGCGGLNVDGCRIARNASLERGAAWAASAKTKAPDAEKIAAPPGQGIQQHPLGGWPGNMVLTHDARCTVAGEGSESRRIFGPLVDNPPRVATGLMRTTRTIGTTKDATTLWSCTPTCPCQTMGHEGVQSLARYFNQLTWSPQDDPAWTGYRYVTKPSTAERELGCEHLPKRTAGELCDREDGSAGLTARAGAGRTSTGRANHHPTVKPIELMRWLCRLVTPRGGVVLELFAGSGTTVMSAILEGFRCVAYELTPEYEPIIRARVAWAEQEHRIATAQLSLFDEVSP